MTGISGSVPPFKFDSNGNVLANINAQNITPNALATNVKTDSAGNVFANLNAQNIYPISYGYDLVVSGSSLSLMSSAGFNSIYIDAGQTLTIPSGVIVIVEGQISGFGQLVVNGTLIVLGSVSIVHGISISGSGVINILYGSTLSINSNGVEISDVTITGVGTLSVPSGYTLTQTGNVTIAVIVVQVAGTWANAGYGITIPSGATVNWTTTGSITTTSPAGTLTVNGVLYYWGAGLTTQSSNAVPTFILKLAGTGIFIASPSSSGGNGTVTISLSATAIAPNSGVGSVTASGKTPYITLSQVSGSAVGLYGLGIYDTTSNIYSIFCLIYIGTASTTYSVSYAANNNQVDNASTTEVFNANGSAGTITLTGTAYV